MTHEQFEHLINIPKSFKKNPPVLPVDGGKESYVLLTAEEENVFYLDVHRKGVFEISKTKVQTRTNRIPLVRIEINAAPHINPDGRRIGRNHIHIYKPGDPENINLPWAYEFKEIPNLSLSVDDVDFMSVFYAMCGYCHIETSNIQGVI